MSSFYDKLISQRAAVDKSWEKLQSNRDREWGLYGHDMGIHPLNMSIGGFIPTRVTTLGARSGAGKTTAVTPMFEAGARVSGGRRCEFLFASWELSPSLIIDRHVCNKTGLTLRMLNQGAKLLDNATLMMIDNAYAEAATLPVTYQTMSLDINNIKALTHEFAKKCKEKGQVEGIKILPVLVIDYLNMAMFDNAGLRTYGIADYMNGLKQLANELEISVFVLAQLSRNSDRESRIPDRADFSDSAAIENASDNLVVLYRPEYHNIKTIKNPRTDLEEDSAGKVLVRILKSRDYGTGDFLMNCDIKHFRFWDELHQWDTPYYQHYGEASFWINQFGLTNSSGQLKIAN